MKKLLGIVLAVVMLFALATTALAYSYDPESGRISGSYSADGNVEHWVDGRLAGGDDLNVAVSEGTHTVEVYVNGKLVVSETVEAVKPTPVPTAEPTAAPTATPTPTVTPTPTPSPTVTPTPTPSPTVTPTPTAAATETSIPTPIPETDSPKPVDETKDPGVTQAPQATKAPAAPADKGAKDDVPKTGDETNILLAVVLFVGFGAAVLFVTKKYAGKN